MSRGRHLNRRAALAAVPAVAAGAWGAWRLRGERPLPTLLSEGIVIGAGGAVVPLEPGMRCDYLPGSRVAAPDDGSGPGRGAIGAPPAVAAMDPGQSQRLAESAAARASGAVLPAGRWQEASAQALIDLLALTGPVLAGPEGGRIAFPPGAVVAGPVSIWRYCWPRDASFAAAALAGVGLWDEAAAVLECLGGWQGADGAFEARYNESGRAPDDRRAQVDGTGWVVWAAERVLRGARDAGAPPERMRDLGSRLAPVIRRCVPRLTWLTAGPGHLPAISPDYWELRETRLTLGTALPVLLGLEAAVRLSGHGTGGRSGLGGTGVIGVGRDPGFVRERSRAVRRAIERAFAPGWGRHAGDDDVDAAIAWAGPPFTSCLEGSPQVRRSARARMARAAGGLAPGRSWRDDGVSWTPETALMAWSAIALGRTERDEEFKAEGIALLDWVVEHRTAVAALPEKVLADGSPAGPAPLAWTCALVILAACEAAQAAGRPGEE